MTNDARVRLIRVFVSSPGDVKAERELLDEVVGRINRTDGESRGVWLDVFKWETGVVNAVELRGGTGQAKLARDRMSSHGQAPLSPWHPTRPAR